MKKFTLLFSLLLYLVFLSLAQVHQHGYNADPNIPEWAKAMYAPNPDWEKITLAKEEYYKTHEFVKNSHTQYYKHYIHKMAIGQGPVTPQSIANDNAYLSRLAKAQNSRSATTANWTCLGPFDYDEDCGSMSYAAGASHVYTTEQSKSNTSVLYAGTANAGVWKSVDKGLNWTLTTKSLLITNVYAIEINFANDNIVYAGTEDGRLFKTSDGGTNWATIGGSYFGANNNRINDIILHPSNSAILFVATESGFYRSTNSGASFSQISTGEFQEIEFHPTNTNIVYAVKYNSTSTRTEFYKSTDNGVSLMLKSTGWPSAGEQKRTEIAVSAASPDRVYASCTGVVNGGSGTYGTYLSTDKGETFTFQCCGTGPGGAHTSASNVNMMGWQPNGIEEGGQYYYDFAYAVMPGDANKVFNGGVNLWNSTDGGKSFTCPSKWSQSGDVNYVHADIHDIKIYGSDIWISCDGGIWYSNNAGATFNKRFKGIAGTDFWGFGIGYGAVGHRVMTGGAYHNGTQVMDNKVYRGDWAVINGGDGAGGEVNPTNDRMIFSDNYGAQKLPGVRTSNVSSMTFVKEANNDYTTGLASNIRYSPNNYNTVYLGETNDLWKSTNAGAAFTSVKNFGEYVSDFEISPMDEKVMYVATTGSSRKIWRTIDGGTNWTNITVPTSLESSTTSNYDLIPSATNASELWAIKVGKSRVFHSTDKGTTWTDMYKASLSGESIQAITHHAGTNGGIYISTNKTVYYRNNTLADWVLYNTGLPAQTPSMKILPDYWAGTVVVASSRSIYESPFYEKAAPVAFFKSDKTTTTCGGAAITFIDQSAVEGSTGITRSWVFSGGVANSTTAGTVTVTYPMAGTYTVALTVTDANGTHTKTATNYITVTGSCVGTTDIGINSLTGINTANKCTQSFTPVVELINAGTITINSYTIKVYLNGVLNKTLPQTVTIPTGQKATLNLGSYNLGTVSEFKVVVENPNGTADNTSNNTSIVKLAGDILSIPSVTVASQSSFSTGSGANQMFDGNTATIWHNNWQVNAPLPHILIFNLNGSYNLSGLDMLNRQDNSNGYPKDVEIATSVDNVTWTTPITTTFASTTSWQTAYFTGSGAKYLRIKVISTISGANTCSMAEVKLRGCAANVYPTVTITSPLNNAPFTAPAAINITANAADTDGTITKVDFYNGATLLGSDASSPYTFTWSSVSTGNYNLTAIATDNSGATTTSTIVTIVVAVPANILPVTSITSPLNNATFTAPATIIINANASDIDGAITKVAFYNGTTLLGSDLSSPYTFTWAGATAGNYPLTVKATDNSNGTTTSSIINVVVNPPVNIVPVVNITSPANNNSYTAPSTITINADASDTDGTITKVEFYNGAVLLGLDVTAPYAVTWSGVAEGNYTLTAKATDNSNAVITSSVVNISVNAAANVLPNISITSPSNNSIYTAIAAITVDVNATDTDGSISKVEFYNGAIKLGEDLTAPYSLLWTNVTAGTYTLTAVATDNVNGMRTSSPITTVVNTITQVNNNSFSTKLLYPNPTSGLVYFGSGIKNIHVSNIEGKMMNISYAPNDDHIDLYTLPKGVYIIRFEKDNQVYVEKITKQ